MLKIWGRKCYLGSRIWVGGKFGAENAISNLQFGWVEDLGWKMLSRISNLGGGKFGVENAIYIFLIWGGGGKFWAENAISNVENLGSKMLSRISNLGFGKFGVENAISKLQFGGVENLG